MGTARDFDSLEYAQALMPVLPELEQAGVAVLAFGIGDDAGRERFCTFTGFPEEPLVVDPDPTLRRALGLHPGQQLPVGRWWNLLRMCDGIGSPGTLKEVLRGYAGDRGAPQQIADDEVIHAPHLSPIQGSLFARAGCTGFQRPFELATIRLRNIGEVLGHWCTCVPRDDSLTQRGGTFLLEADDTLQVEHRDKGVLGFSETMSRPM